MKNQYIVDSQSKFLIEGQTQPQVQVLYQPSTKSNTTTISDNSSVSTTELIIFRARSSAKS